MYLKWIKFDWITSSFVVCRQNGNQSIKPYVRPLWSTDHYFLYYFFPLYFHTINPFDLGLWFGCILREFKLHSHQCQFANSPQFPHTLCHISSKVKVIDRCFSNTYRYNSFMHADTVPFRIKLSSVTNFHSHRFHNYDDDYSGIVISRWKICYISPAWLAWTKHGIQHV